MVIRLATAPLSISTFPGGWMLEIGGMLLFRLRNKGAVTDAKHVLRAENGCWVGGHESAWILLDAPREVGPKKVASPPKLTLLE